MCLAARWDRLLLRALGRAAQADVTAAEPGAPVDCDQTRPAGGRVQVGVRACGRAGERWAAGLRLHPGRRGEPRAGEPGERAGRRACGRARGPGARGVCVEVSRESELVRSFRQTIVRCGDSGAAVPGGRRKSNPCVLPLFEEYHWMEGVNLRSESQYHKWRSFPGD